MADTKMTYSDDLRRRMREHFDWAPADRLEDIFLFVKEEALRSWKNGLETGRKRAALRPNGKSAPTNGSALQHGRLRPAQREA